jgi:hypothetical protein
MYVEQGHDMPYQQYFSSKSNATYVIEMSTKIAVINLE